ncbi:hypothetical protein [Streptomyces abikoensis]|nr:hypothetical protein [Streptomyces abikoensis]
MSPTGLIRFRCQSHLLQGQLVCLPLLTHPVLVIARQLWFEGFERNL